MSDLPPSGRPIVLRLYIVGNAPNSLLAVANIKAVCSEHFPNTHTLEIVNVLDHPLQAMADGILVTPTLVKLSPLPVQRVIGNLSEMGYVVRALVSP